MFYEVKKPKNMSQKEFNEHIAGYINREELKQMFKGRAS